MATTLAERPSDTRLVCFEALEPDTASTNAILRAFERLRRALSVKVCGDEGMFAGYERIVFGSRLEEHTGPVLVRAALLQRLGSTHAVEYVAVAYDPAVPWDPASDQVILLSHGVGRTLRRMQASQ